MARGAREVTLETSLLGEHQAQLVAQAAAAARWLGSSWDEIAAADAASQARMKAIARKHKALAKLIAIMARVPPQRVRIEGVNKLATIGNICAMPKTTPMRASGIPTLLSRYKL